MDCIQKLRRDELDSALDVLRMMFDQSQPPPNSTAAWSAAAVATTLATCMWHVEGTTEGNWPSMSRGTNMGFYPFPDTGDTGYIEIYMFQLLMCSCPAQFILQMCTILVST